MTEVLSRSPSTWNIGTTMELSQNIAAGVTKPTVPADEEEVEGEVAEAGRRRV